jgi:tetrahydromethanopterin S-methyltransferase subunit C
VSSLPDHPETDEGESSHPATSFSFTFSIIGFCACVYGVGTTMRSADYGRGALVGFVVWCGFALIALICAIVANYRKRGVASVCALVLAVVPFVIALIGLLGSGG